MLQSFISLQQCTTSACHPFWMSSGRALDESSPNGLRRKLATPLICLHPGNPQSRHTQPRGVLISISRRLCMVCVPPVYCHQLPTLLCSLRCRDELLILVGWLVPVGWLGSCKDLLAFLVVPIDLLCDSSGQCHRWPIEHELAMRHPNDAIALGSSHVEGMQVAHYRDAIFAVNRA
jgi:hypothetical protein